MQGKYINYAIDRFENDYLSNDYLSNDSCEPLENITICSVIKIDNYTFIACLKDRDKNGAIISPYYNDEFKNLTTYFGKIWIPIYICNPNKLSYITRLTLIDICGTQIYMGGFCLLNKKFKPFLVITPNHDVYLDWTNMPPQLPEVQINKLLKSEIPYNKHNIYTKEYTPLNYKVISSII